MGDFDPGALTLLIGAIATGVIGIIGAFTSRNRNKADVRTELEKNVDARVNKIMESDRLRIEKLEATADEQEEEISELRDKIRVQEEEIGGWRRRWGAVGRVFRALASQWPGPDVPRLDPIDLADIEDTVPSEWLRRPPAY